jgi:hypothetical protein
MKACIFCAVTVALALLGTKADANVWRYDSAGSTWIDYGDDHTNGQLDVTNAIHFALAAAQPGDTVEIRDSDPYILTNNHGYVMNTPGVTLRGQVGVTATIRFDGAGTNAFFYVNAADIRFENFTLDNHDLLYGNYAFQAAGKLGDNVTYTCQNMTITGCTFLGVRGAVNSGSGRLDGFTFTHNTIGGGGTRYGLGKSGINLGVGDHLIGSNYFEHSGNGDVGAPDHNPENPAPPEPVIDVESLYGTLQVQENTFVDHDGQYAVHVRCDQAFGTVTFQDNVFLSPIGNQGAEMDLFPVSVGFAVGYCEDETSDAAELPPMLRVEPWSPNPFSRSTTLAFTLARTDFVSLTVHDLQGRTVATLLQGPKPSGRHEVVFHADGLASGEYFVRLQTSRGILSQKLLLNK